LPRKPLTYRPEKEVQRSICEVLGLLGIVHTVTDASAVFGFYGERRQQVRKDWPDITGVLPGGRALFIECKSLTGRASEGQKAMIETLNKQGALAIIARSGAEVYDLLKGMK
jgi:hypothetical protein